MCVCVCVCECVCVYVCMCVFECVYSVCEYVKELVKIVSNSFPGHHIKPPTNISFFMLYNFHIDSGA